MRNLFVCLIAACLGLVVGTSTHAAAATPKSKTKPRNSSVKTVAKTVAKTPVRAATTTGKAIGRSPWRAPNYADSTEGDNVDGDDLVVRRAVVEALGPLNGSVVVTDPETGRILSIVNQKLAYTSGFQPCSTVKVPVALPSLVYSMS